MAMNIYWLILTEDFGIRCVSAKFIRDC